MTTSTAPPAFAIGTGRCGTHFIANVYSQESCVAASHERYPLAEAFERYRKWYELPIDDEGFLYLMEQGIRGDLAAHAISLEASAYLSLSVTELRERFDARFILMVRRPDAVVNSLWGKGWYRDPYVQRNPELALGYQDGSLPHHTFSRIAPKGVDFKEWQGLTRIGKIAWFWAALNEAALKQLEALPSDAWRLVKLEEFDHAAYGDLSRFLGCEPTLSQQAYLRLVRSRPGRRPISISTRDWSESERSEFEAHVAALASRFGYPYKDLHLARSEGAEEPRSSRSQPIRWGLGMRRLYRITRASFSRMR